MTAPIWLTIAQATKLTGLSKDTLMRAVHSETHPLKAKKTSPNGGGKTLVRVADLESWFDGLVDA